MQYSINIVFSKSFTNKVSGRIFFPKFQITQTSQYKPYSRHEVVQHHCDGTSKSLPRLLYSYCRTEFASTFPNISHSHSSKSPSRLPRAPLVMLALRKSERRERTARGGSLLTGGASVWGTQCLTCLVLHVGMAAVDQNYWTNYERRLNDLTGP